MKRTLLAAVGDANDVRTWSGIPYHLLQEGKRQRLIDQGLSLSTDGWAWKSRRYAWNLRNVMLGRGRGGFQYSVEFLERLWAPVRSLAVNARLINCFQLFPPSLVTSESTERWYFLDQTLIQLFDTYGIREEIGARIAEEAIERERDGYRRAKGIVMHSQSAASSVIQDYGIEPAKVAIVVPAPTLTGRSMSVGPRDATGIRNGQSRFSRTEQRRVRGLCAWCSLASIRSEKAWTGCSGPWTWPGKRVPIAHFVSLAAPRRILLRGFATWKESNGSASSTSDTIPTATWTQSDNAMLAACSPDPKPGGSDCVNTTPLGLP